MNKNVLLCFLAMPFLAHGQYEFYNKGASVTVQNGALIHVQGTLTNDNGSGSGQIDNDGILEVKGNFENKAGSLFTSPQSNDAVVKFVGSGKQQIRGSLNTLGSASFFNLLIDQTSSADTVEMQSNILVEGSLLFGATNVNTTYLPSYVYTDNSGTNGILKTYDNTGEYVLDITNGNTDAIVGYPALVMYGNPNTAFIATKGSIGSSAGGLQRKITNQTAYVFPTGTVDNGYNASLLNFTSLPGSGGSVKTKFCDGTTSPRGYVGTILQSCIGCNNPNYSVPDNPGYNRYFASNPCNAGAPQWILFEESGILEHGYWSFDATNNNAGLWKYDIEVFPNSFITEGSPDDTWRVLKYHNGAGDYGFDPSDLTVDWGAQINNVDDPNDLLTYTKNAGCYSGLGVPGGVYTDFSQFSMHKSNSGNGLPVELIYLKAEPVNNQFIKVSWATAIEVNNDGFEVLRSTDGVNFFNVGWVDGNDNSSVLQTYTFDDHNVAPNVFYYYKLRQVDNDGKSEETYIVSASLTGSETFVISDFIPNPTREASKLIITTSTEQTIQVRMYDIIGQVISERQYNLSIGSNIINFDGQNVADGTYTAVINAGNKVYSKKLVVTK